MTQALTQYQGLRVEEQKTKLFAPHRGGELTFLHPPYGPDSYANVGLAIVQDHFKMPTMAEIASFVYAAFNSDNRYGTEIKDDMTRARLWGYTGILYVPNEGAFFQDDPEIRRGMPFMDRDSLEQKLNAKDPNVRFVEFGYQVGEMSPLELANNPYVIGLVGEEGAEKLARIADEYDHKPHLLSFESIDTDVTRVSALDCGHLGHRLGVNGNDLGYGLGRAFAVLDKTGGATNRAEK